MGGTRILILGGTTEARRLADVLVTRADLDVVLSLAGRTVEPAAQPVPVRIGGFGGAEGLARYLKDQAVDLLIDATHPFAARISLNAAQAAELIGLPAFALRRAAWLPVEGDRWNKQQTVPEAIAALGPSPRRVFLAIGRQEAHEANAAPNHRYWVRSVDRVEPALTVLDVTYINAKGPFRLADELALLSANDIDVVIAKNSGGSATYAKIEAARQLGIEIIMIERPPAADMPTVETIEAALRRIDHLASSLMKRGV